MRKENTRFDEFGFGLQRTEHARVVVCDNCKFFMTFAQRELSKIGIGEIDLIESVDSKQLIPSVNHADLLIVDSSWGTTRGVDFISAVKSSGHNGILILASGDFSIELIDRAVWAGVDDLFIKNNRFSLRRDFGFLLSKYFFENDRPVVSEQILPDSSFLHCIGLSRFERELLESYYPEFLSSKELASILCKKEGYIRKVLSNIQHKFHVNGAAQLGRMLTLCSRFGRR